MGTEINHSSRTKLRSARQCLSTARRNEHHETSELAVSAGTAGAGRMSLGLHRNPCLDDAGGKASRLVQRKLGEGACLPTG